MAVTITYGAQERWGRYTILHGTIAFDDSYSANGEDVSDENWNGTPVINVFIDPLASNSTYFCTYDATLDVVFVGTRADGEEVADETDLEALIVPFWVLKQT